MGDTGRGECCGLQYDGRGLGRNLGSFPSHDTGDSDRTGVISDQQVIGGESAADAVEAAFDAMRAGNMFIHVNHLTVEERALLEGERSFDVRY